MKNLTITVDEETLQWARIEAARRGTSVSRLVGEMLAEHREKTSDYERARQAFLARGPFRTTGKRKPYPSREEIYDREIFRRYERSDL
ncbi:hypothetical protein [Spiribacter onubensis]|uniref:CopG family transcriptional regulator n=1 Tax=Spiribacter onubensis TaxID=3122420 RepID=A0ABV3SBL1_9GAMM